MVVDDGKGARTQRNSWRAQRRVGVYLSCTGIREKHEQTVDLGDDDAGW